MTDKDILSAGTLRVHPSNPRYFTDDSASPIWLTGSHTWAVLQERAYLETPMFDYDTWLDDLVAWGHNFLRLWSWEHTQWMQFNPRPIRYFPPRYLRTGPGTALDGGAKFDLTKFNEDYFNRLRYRVEKAGQRGIYVSVMLFQGFSLSKLGDPAQGHNAFLGHPMHPANNTNGIDGDPNRSGTGHQVHTLDVPEIVKLQEAFVAKVIDTLNDLDHVLWEISNESETCSINWHYHMIRFIHEYERTTPRQHPVGMTGSPIPDEAMFASEAEWISPSTQQPYKTDMPCADGSKVMIVDTDHFDPWNAYMNPAYPWQALMRGHNFILMDPYRDARYGSPEAPHDAFDAIRIEMGHALKGARSLDLAGMVPATQLSSTGYCLANRGHEYCAYAPEGGPITLDLTSVKGTFVCQWYDSSTGAFVESGQCKGGAKRALAPPCASARVVHVRRTPTALRRG
jgi:hypothetical protein